MKIAILADIHGNLPALQAVLQDCLRQGYDEIYSIGDAIAIGPQPAECLDLLLNTPHTHLLLGNHEMWYAFGLPEPQPEWMSDGEVVHQRWVHEQLDPALREAVAEWPVVIEESFEGVRTVLLHYEPLDAASTLFHSLDRDAGLPGLDRLFGHYGADLVFYGHSHIAADDHGQARYINPGSLGCTREPAAPYALLDCDRGRCTVEVRAVPYDDAPLFAAFEERRVPDREFLYGAFFGGRYP